ncbi:alpha/beta fold hydrolase [Ensifer adhaerens]|uniref:alpha/beta fold hydrolase n=1 Tax=Ensifer adhaerens TaxID=106592 RepID=UPI00098EF72A|nr:alpha/beta hydrolase [Ensifer adhaerens]
MGQGVFREHHFRSSDGLLLYARNYGPTPSASAKTPIICLPGLTRNSRDFHQLASFLSTAREIPVISLDYRGRGNAQRDTDKSRYTLVVETADVMAACAHFAVEKAFFIGTSRGGLILHHLIDCAPSLIAAVVLNDIGPVIEIEGLLAIRDYLNSKDAPTSWATAAPFLRTLHGGDFPALSDADWSDMAKAIYRDEGGVPVADFDPAIALPLRGLTPETPLPDLWKSFDALNQVPLMVVRGGHSRLLSEATVREMHRRHRGMTAFTAPGQGHAPLLHLDGPREAVAAFIDGVAGPR